MLENLGELGKSIEAHIEESVKEVIAQLVEPVAVLKKYEGVEVLNLDEVCEILRFESRDKIRDAVRRGELPGVQVGRELLFPKRLVAELLMGTWRKEKKEKARRPQKITNISDKVRQFVN